jgi:hypothetical protein
MASPTIATVSDGAHLLIPFASGPAAALAALALPQLQRLLGRMGEASLDTAPPESLSPPHERAWARHHGLAPQDGLVPQAAWAARASGLPEGAWAWITPCHWRVGSDHVAMSHLEELQLDDDAAAQVLAAVRPYFAEDGIELTAADPRRWLARSETFRTLPTASLDRAAGRVVDAWMPRQSAARPLRRLQQEVQMLLYTNHFNDERERRGLLPVNSFWVSGTGALPTDFREAPGLQLEDLLRTPALHGDTAAWCEAWRALDAGPVAQVLAKAERGDTVRLTLCGEAGARTWSTADAGGWRRFSRRLRPLTPLAALEGL